MTLATVILTKITWGYNSTSYEDLQSLGSRKDCTLTKKIFLEYGYILRRIQLLFGVLRVSDAQISFATGNYMFKVDNKSSTYKIKNKQRPHTRNMSVLVSLLYAWDIKVQS